MDNLAQYLDLANHSPATTSRDVEILCSKVLEHGFNSAFLNPYFVPLARQLMADKGKVGTVISFPLGQETTAVKVISARAAVLSGADELDISLNVGLLKEHNWAAVLSEAKEIVLAVRAVDKAKIIKFIPETGFLTPDEIKKSAEIILSSGADFYKTCSGLGPRGATVEDVKLVREAIGSKLKVKVAGGVTSYDQAVAFIQAGADRIGTSHAVEIIEQAPVKNSSSDSE